MTTRVTIRKPGLLKTGVTVGWRQSSAKVTGDGRVSCSSASPASLHAASKAPRR
jgi:hypothetical protein